MGGKACFPCSWPPTAPSPRSVATSAGSAPTSLTLHDGAELPMERTSTLLAYGKLSEATVRTHLEHIYTKLNIHSARELMISNLDQLADSDMR